MSAAQPADNAWTNDVAPLMQEYCLDCHNPEKIKGDLNLEPLVSDRDIARHFKTWEQVLDMVTYEDMPPIEEDQPTGEEREALIHAISTSLERAVTEHAGDPGEVVLRRLTSAEYAYTIQDLTGLALGLEKTFVGEAVGGEGFSNVGGVQFMQDAMLERYLEAAKTVAAHALIASGPLSFSENPGKTGQELSAINRIQEIYREHGFRTGAGEGAKAYGLDRYAKAFYASWKYKHRHNLGLPDLTLRNLADTESISIRFLEHIWRVMEQDNPTFPTNQLVSLWKRLPVPDKPGRIPETRIRKACSELYDTLFDWQRTLAASTRDDEEYAVLTTQPFEPRDSYPFRVRMNQPPAGQPLVFQIFVKAASDDENAAPAVVWKDPKLRMRSTNATNTGSTVMPLHEVATPETANLLKFGAGIEGQTIAPGDFVTVGPRELTLRLNLPQEQARVEFLVEPTIDIENGEDCLIRCEITDGSNARETAASTGSASALIASPDSPKVGAWKSGILDFALNLPQVSHREATPSDRDWIPQPFDNTYNKPERNYFHTAIKYHRDDAFLTNHMLDDQTARTLDQAWTDLLTAFDYHDTIFRFILKKHQLESPATTLRALDPEWIKQTPPAVQKHLYPLFNDFLGKQATLEKAEAGHVEDALDFAEQAWRRPLAETDRNRLASYYRSLRKDRKLDHPEAIRTLLVRLLVAPEFLYRIENPAGSQDVVALNDWELASRLSYFLWSSKPDSELLRAADAGELQKKEGLIRQARRMLRDPKARRFATEFFGQWFGFYRFDDFNGIDTGRFTEFGKALKEAMYDEAVSFFSHIIREDRPVDDILFADYTFLNERLAGHYGIPWDGATEDGDRLKIVKGVKPYHRGGLLQMSVVLATTSAPLRTSAVKRGDWILRRVLGTPTPPPPADAGSIPADDVQPDGFTVRERLEAHRRDNSCVNCHTRIDPLGFALESFDPIGRWRETYRDGSPIDTRGILHDGTQINELQDLHDYLKDQTETVNRNLCRKLLGYALGRSERLSDRLLIDKMVESLETENRFSNLVVQVVSSPQFRNKRGQHLEAAALDQPALNEKPDPEI